MGNIPGFSAAIFPPESIVNLNLVANLGLVLYLFMIGLETDVRFLLSNWRIATTVAFAGLALPFGLGCAIAWGLYNEFRHDDGVKHIDFPVYMLFIGVAVAITARHSLTTYSPDSTRRPRADSQRRPSPSYAVSSQS